MIGVPAYTDDAITDLPFIENDLAEIATVLRGSGYDVEIHEIGRTDGGSIDTAIELFIADAAPGQTLLIYLSGHGVHNRGMDYLVPSGAMTRSRNFPSRCVAIDFEAYVEPSHAGDVVVFVDACREGIDLREMGTVNAASWSSRKVEQTASRRFAYVYACSAGERARYTTTGATTFSLFSRALSEAIADEGLPGTLAGIETAVQTTLDSLTSEHQLPWQRVRILTAADKDDFLVLSRPDHTGTGRRGEHPWVTVAGEHVVWEQVREGPGVDALREATVHLVGHLAEAWTRDSRSLNADPWRDSGFAERMSSKIRWLLLNVLNPDKLALSPAEAALLVACPFLYETFWARQTAGKSHVNPAVPTFHDSSGDRGRFEHFMTGYGRLLRRAKRVADSGDLAAQAGIGWWLFHRWLTRQPDLYRTDHLTDLLPPEVADAHGLIGDVFASERVIEMLRALRADASFVARTDRETALRPSRQIAGSTDDEQAVRERLISYLLAAAYLFAINPRALPEVVVDHLGISYAVDLQDLVTTIAKATWEARGRTRVLEARCTHPAVDLALREQASAMDALLAEIDTVAGDDSTLAPLADMPTHATADRVRAARTTDGKRAYDSPGFRFRLADDRVQELLMGSQLYGDPALAVRELYQNALDACRYRDARTSYLTAKGRRPPAWTGQITFSQGTDEHGREYLDCTDNGIGMGMRELVEVFSHAGVSFADLPEYIEEQAEWKTEDIELYPNGRFGIGVLSYFMLADDITVTTCRLDRAGRPTNILEVHIAGPGALFRVRDLGPGGHSFTTVRLHLRAMDKPLSCVDLLRRILWIADYAVEATDATGTQEWEACRLSEVAPIGSEDPLSGDVERHSDPIDGTSTPQVWWCDGEGAILADGLWAGTQLFGAIVNLTGPNMPQLTVDRKRILSYNEAETALLLRRAVPSLVANGSRVLTHAWLSGLAVRNLALADEIIEAAIRENYHPWIIGHRETDIAVVGCFPRDLGLFGRESLNTNRNNLMSTSAKIFDWRFLAWARSGQFQGISVSPALEIPVALPSDEVILREITDDQGASLTHIVIAAAATDRPPADVAIRLTALGLTTPDPSTLPNHANRDDRTLLSADLDGQSPWLDPTHPISLQHIVVAAAITNRSPADVATRLTALGFTTPTPSTLPNQPDRDDRTLLSQHLNGQSPWLDPTQPIPLGHIVAAATTTNRPPADIATRLTTLGLTTPDPSTLPNQPDRDDRTLLSTDLDGQSPWLDPTQPIPLGHIVAAAAITNRSPADVATRLTALGFTTPTPSTLPNQPDRDDRTLLSQHLNSRNPWLDPTQPIPLGHIVTAAAITNRPPADIATRLTTLGFTTPSALPKRINRDDRTLLSTDLDGQGPWLDPTKPTSLQHIITAAATTDRPPADVATRLTTLGFTTPSALPKRINRDDRTLLSQHLNGQSPWLDPTQPIPLQHIVAAAATTNRPPADIATRLTTLGFTTPDPSTLPNQPDRDDRTLLSQNLNGQSPWLDPTKPISLQHIVAAAATTNRPPADIATRLTTLGFTTPDPSTLPNRLDHDDRTLLSQNLNGRRPWLDPTQPIPLQHIVAAAATTNRPPADIATRLTALGFTTPDPSTLPNQPDRDDRTLLSADLDGQSPWLDPTQPIPLGHIVTAAATTNRSPADIATRLTTLGFRHSDLIKIDHTGTRSLPADDRH
ncbi:caspase family protein [Streptosporangium sp. NPDC002524]|uniref:wHTH domain-containing protein n=1 Tax=Streptosporangium sp. NPDC002524 TaxID=3154537 RepID=UPI0033198E0E